MLQNIPAQTVTQANNQISPRLMQQAHSKQLDSNYGAGPLLSSDSHQQQIGALAIGSQQQQSSVSITQNAGNLILQKGQPQPMTQIGMKDIWRDNSKTQKMQETQKVQSTLQSLAGINEFKQKVNIMLQNQMYLNMNSQNFTPGQGQATASIQNAKYDTRQRGVADLKQLNSIWPSEETQIQENKNQLNSQGMGYGYVLGINDLRELKEMRAGISNTGGSTKTSHSHGEAANNVPVSSLYKKKQNRFDVQDGSLQVNDNGDQRDLKNILTKNNRNHSTRKASGHNQDDLVALQAITNAGRSAEGSSNNNVQMTRIQKMNRSNQYEHIMNGGMLALSPTNYKEMQNSVKLQGGKKQSIPNGQHSTQPSAEKKFHTFTNSNMNPQSRKASQFQMGGQVQTDATKMNGQFNDKAQAQGGLPSSQGNAPTYNTYSSNNQKQQQRRKLLFEYGLEKKLQSQGLSAIPSGQTTTTAQNQQQQISVANGQYGFRQPLQTTAVPVYMGPGGPGPWVSGQPNSTANTTAGANGASMKHAYLRKGNQPTQLENQQQQQFIDCLMNIEIESLDQNEQDKLKFLSDQYQNALQQVQQYEPEDQPRESNLSHYSKASKKSQNLKEDILNQSSHLLDSEKKAQELKSDVYSSQDRFKENEKNLSEVRLIKREDREAGEQTPGGNSPKPGMIVNAASSQSSSRKQIGGNGIQRNTSKKSLNASSGLQGLGAQGGLSNHPQAMSQVASDKNLLKNSSQTRFQIKSGQGFLAGPVGGQNNIIKNNDYGNMYQNEPGKALSSPNNLNNKRRRDNQTLGGTMQPPSNDFISTEDSSVRYRGFENSINLCQAGTSVFDQIKAQQQKRQSQIQAQQMQQQNPPPQYRLDVQNQKPPMTPPNANKKPKPPHPGLAVSDIKVMTSVQRINIFKLLQRREKSKFISIQQAKLQKLEGTFEVAAKKSARNQDGSEKTQNEKFLDIVRRQAFNTTGNTKGLPQNINYEQIRKQWVSDLKAFGVFQQNELWQFGQMTESQQRQILVCNLQQGKFNGLFDEPSQQSPNIQPQIVQSKSKPKVTEKNGIWQGAQRRNAYGSALGNVGVNASIEKQNPNAFRNSLNVTSSRQKIGEFMQIEDGGDTQAQRYTQESPQKPFSQEHQKQSSISNRSRSISIKDPKLDNMGESIENNTEVEILSPKRTGENPNAQTLDKTIDIQVKNINGNDTKIVVEEENQNPDALKTDDKQPNYQTNQSFDPENKLTEDLGDYQQKQDVLTRNPNNPNVINSEQSEVSRTRQIVPFQIMNKFEDSKNQFEACLKDIIVKMQSQNYQRNRHLKNMGLNNYLPNFPKHLINEKNINGQYNQVQIRGGRNEDQSKANNTTAASTIQNDKYKPKFKTEKEKQLAKLRLGDKAIDSDPSRLNIKKQESTTTGTVPDSTKNKKPSDSATQAKESENNQEEKKDEMIPEEVKKPRYFPPRRLPNPFESAAQEQERFIQARKDALAKYSNISKNRFKQDESAPFKYVLRPGNNSKMIMNVLEKSGRLEPKHDDDTCMYPGWEPADDHYDSLYNFKWKPTSGGIKYDMISKHGLKQLVNHVKGHGQLTTKDNLFINLKAYYETQKMSIYDVVPLTIVLDYLDENIGDKVENFLTIMKTIDKNIDQDVEVINKKLHEYQIQKEKALKTPLKISNCCHGQQNLWMLKPTGLNRGIGIHIFQTFDQLREIMGTHYGIGRGIRDKSSIFQTHNHNHHRDKAGENADKEAAKAQMQNFTFVIQKLIEKPMLYMKRKFDIRQWVLFNSWDGKIYMFNEPYVRTSSKEYIGYDPDLPNEDQIFMQLTNNAVQKDGEDYGKFEEGNIISIQTLFEALKSEPAAENNSMQTLVENFRKRMKQIIIDTMKSVRGKMLCQKHTFELLGYDFIFDEELNTILIEVNTNPCLEESNQLLKRLLPRAIDDLLNITMDPLFGINQYQNTGDNNNSVSQPKDKYKSKFKLTGDVFGSPELNHAGYPDDQNLWEHIFTVEQ